MERKIKRIRKRDFLLIVYGTYCDKSTNYLIALRDALSIMILARVRESGYFKDTLNDLGNGVILEL